MTMGTVLKNWKQIIRATLQDFINSYNDNHVGIIIWVNGNTNVALHIVNHI